MGMPVVTVASGGMPVVDVTATTGRGTPVTEATNGRGRAVTKVTSGGMAVAYETLVTWPPAVPTSDLFFANVKLLMGFNGANASTGAPGMTDESSVARGNATVNGSAQISTTQAVFGGSSLSTPVSGSFLSYADSADWYFSNQPFTIELRMYPTSLGGFLVAQWLGNPSWTININANVLTVNFSTNGADNNADLVSATPLSVNTWYVVCLDFDGTKYRLYQNGVMVASSTTIRNLNNSTDPLSIGATASGTAPYAGYIDELRITKGTARYASDSGYTVAASAFPRS